MEISRFRKLKKKAETDEYFITNGRRFKSLNESLKNDPEQIIAGTIKETDNVFFIRSDESDAGDVIWIEVSREEVEYYKRTGDRSFLKNDLVI